MRTNVLAARFKHLILLCPCPKSKHFDANFVLLHCPYLMHDTLKILVANLTDLCPIQRVLLIMKWSRDLRQSKACFSESILKKYDGMPSVMSRCRNVMFVKRGMTEGMV